VIAERGAIALDPDPTEIRTDDEMADAYNDGLLYALDELIVPNQSETIDTVLDAARAASDDPTATTDLLDSHLTIDDWIVPPASDYRRGQADTRRALRD
jgi:hypothetical protein